MSKKYPITGVQYATFTNNDPLLTTADRFTSGNLNKLITDHRLFFKDDREVTKAMYNTTFGITQENPDLFHDTQKDVGVQLKDAIRDRRLYMIDAPIKYSEAQHNNPLEPRFKSAEWQNRDFSTGNGGKRNKSRKPKRRNSRSNRRKTLNKSKNN